VASSQHSRNGFARSRTSNLGRSNPSNHVGSLGGQRGAQHAGKNALPTNGLSSATSHASRSAPGSQMRNLSSFGKRKR
jgi:hypothetical protein